MPEAALPDSHGDILLIHHGFIPVTESVKTAPLDPQFVEKWIKFPFANHIGVPGRTVPGCEQKTRRVGLPPSQIAPKVLYQLRRDFAQAFPLTDLTVWILP